MEAAIVAARVEHRRGQDWLGPELGVPARTVSRVLRRHNVPYLRVLDPLTGEVIRSSKATAVRYERKRPGELVHVDVKKIGKIPDGGGWRALGRVATVDHRHKKVRIGYDYVHSMVDDHSRLAYSEILPDEKGPTCGAFIERAATYFAAHGIPVIQRVITDNHFSYRNSNDVAAVMAALGAKHKFIRPHCPWQNGKVERFNRTLATEWAYRQVFTTNDQRAAALAPWLEEYNTRRRHTALGGLPPVSRLSPT
jgi:transposase InsO family protein